jgi:steroid delta-isomerase-like uncharacterized protein
MHRISPYDAVIGEHAPQTKRANRVRWLFDEAARAGASATGSAGRSGVGSRPAWFVAALAGALGPRTGARRHRLTTESLLFQQTRSARRRFAGRLTPVLLLIFGAIAAPLALYPVTNVGAQDASPVATAADLPEIVVAWADAWTSGDADRFVDLYAEDAVYEEIPTATVARGHAEIGAFFEATHANFADIRATPVRGFQEGSHAVLEGLFAGRAGERAFEVPFVAVIELDGDRIRHSRDYFDLYSVMVQIGALPAPGDTGTPAATPSG